MVSDKRRDVYARIVMFSCCLLILTGCASLTPPSRPPIPANLASPCPAVDSFTLASLYDLMKSYLKLVIQYSECAGKHAAVSEVNK
jgi:hypothetical protein